MSCWPFAASGHPLRFVLAMASETFSIGQRVILDGIHLGTVGFYGTVEVDPTHQPWVGIEWDDPSRGKHSGRFKDGPVLFHTLVPNSATFMKPSSRLQVGRSFLTALKQKYLDEDRLNSKTKEGEEDDCNMRKVALQFSLLDRLRVIGLEACRINGPGDESELIELDGLLESVETLNLSSNMFSNMGDISIIAGKLPRLKTLILSSNRFHFVPKTLAGLRSIEALYLDSTLLTWQQSIQVASQIEALSELSLLNCRISVLGMQSNNLPLIESLSVLTLDENELCDWEDLICGLKLLPRLQQLNLRRNHLRISAKNDDETTPFHSLRSLNLMGNSVQFGTEIDYLRDWFPSLTSLFLVGNAIYDLHNSGNSRLLAIARFPTLTHLDGSQITTAERVEGDSFYWSTIQKEVTDANQIVKSHPRYLELLAKFGPPEATPTGVRSSSLKAKMINISIIWPDYIPIEKSNIQVLPSMTGRGLRVYLAKMIRRSGFEYPHDLNQLADDLQLSLIINGDDGSTGLHRSIDFDDNLKTLAWYGLADNDVLQVHLNQSPKV